MTTLHLYLVIFISAVMSLHVVGQGNGTAFNPSGKPIIQVFGNFDYNATKNAQKKYGFWFGRAHFGYEYQFSQQFSGKIVLDMGRPTSVGQITITDASGKSLNTTNTSKEGSYYTMTLKFASLEWKPNPQIRFQAGGILQNNYNTQEKFWGYRYVAQTFQDKYYSIPSSDLGLIMYFTPNKKIGFDLALTNGEGFRFDQDPYGDVKLAGGIDFLPIKNLQTRLYYDNSSSKSPAKPATQQLICLFAGYKIENKFRIGAEYNRRVNHQFIKNQDLYGVSVYGSYTVRKNWEILARYDRLDANIHHNDASSEWSLRSQTGKAFLSGVHFSPLKGINLSLNYQGWKPDENSLTVQHHALLSFEYKL